MYPAILFLISYFIGGIPFGLVFGKIFKKEDIRRQGSGNIGATNAFRILGPGLGVLTFIADFSKGAVAVLLMKHFIPTEKAMALAIVAVVLGHCFSPYLKLKGGKGVATVAGAIFVCRPYFILICLFFFLTIVIFSKYVSLGSIMTMFAGGLFGFFLLDVCLELRLAIVFVAFLSIFQHRSNLKRLMAGTEVPFGSEKNG